MFEGEDAGMAHNTFQYVLNINEGMARVPLKIFPGPIYKRTRTEIDGQIRQKL